MSATPRTDAHTIQIEFTDGPFKSVTYVPVEFSKTLERELATSTAEREKLRGIIYRSVWDRIHMDQSAIKVTKEDIEASLEVFYATQKGIK